MQLDMSERLRPVYSNLLEGKQRASAAGLIYQSLKPEAGYSGEELHYQAESQEPYVVRCQRIADGEIAAELYARHTHWRGINP